MPDAPEENTGKPWEKFQTAPVAAAGKPWEKFQSAPAEASAKPWERFKTSDGQSKPWERYGAQEPEKPPSDDQRGFPYDKPGHTYGSILPLERDEKGKLSLAAPELIRSPARAFMKIGDAAAGKAGAEKNDPDVAKLAGMLAGAEFGGRGVPGRVAEQGQAAKPPTPTPEASQAVLAPKPELKPAIRKPDGSIVSGEVGKTHADIPDIGKDDKRGFLDGQGNFLNRKEAAEAAKAKGLDVPKSLHSEELNAAVKTPAVQKPEPGSPLSEPPAVDRPRRYEDQLFQLEGNAAADAIEARDRLKQLPEGIKPETWEKLYHYRESQMQRPKAGAPEPVPLTPEEKAIYDQHVQPLLDENAKYYQALKAMGETVDQPVTAGHVTRKVAGKTWSFGEMLDRAQKGLEDRLGGAGTRSMRKTTDSSANRRKVYLATNDAGEKRVVYIGGDRNVLPFDEALKGHFDLGPIGKVKGKLGQGSKFMDQSSSTWHIEQATTKEIEAASKIRYSKNILANELDENVKLKAAYRNAQFVNQSIKKMEGLGLAVKRGETPVPPKDAQGRPFRTPTIAQFQNYMVEPRIADALDRFKSDTHADPGTLAATLNKAGRVMNFMMFLNPIAHDMNVLNHMVVEGGLVGNIKGAPSLARNLTRAVKAVVNGDDGYVRAVRAGASLPYSKMLSADLHDTLIRKLGGEMERDPTAWNKIASAAGLPSAKALFSRIGNMPQQFLWATSDMMTYAKILQNAERAGGSLEKGIRETELHMPNYRVPGQVLGKRWLAEVFGSPVVGRFGRYQYGRLASYFRMTRDAFGPDRTLGQRAHAFDQMLMLGVYLYLLYPAFDKAWQEVTGDKDVKVVRSGAASIPQALIDVMDGDKKAGDLSQSLFTLGVPIEMPVELYEGKYLWSGQPIVRDADIRAGRWGQVGRDAADYALSKTSLPGQILGGKKTAEQLGLEALGVKKPDPGAADKKAYYKAKDEQAARRRANKE